jgi:AmpE protein
MTFIITLIALIIERFFHWSHLRQWHWFMRYQYFLNVRFGNWPKWMLLTLCILPPVLITGLIGCLVSGWLYEIPKIIFGVLILVYCMGPQNLWVQIYSCIRALNNDDPHVAIEQVKTSFGITAIDQPQTFHQGFTRAIFIAANQRVFAAIFWFILLGPLGAILYRTTNLCADNPMSAARDTAVKWHQVLNWLPVRIFTFIFALGGHFTKVFAAWKKYVRGGLQSNDVMLGECGIAGLCVENSEHLPEDGSCEKEALALLDRVFVMVLVILAVLILVNG